MTEPIRIDVPNVEHKNLKLVDEGFGELCLYETYFTYNFRQDTEETKEDDELLTEQWKYDAKGTHKKSGIESITRYYEDRNDCWYVTIYMAATKWNLVFEYEQDANELFDKLLQWWNP